MNKKRVFKSPGIFTIDGMETYYPNLSKEFSEIIDMVSKFPNDQDLGRELRKFIEELKEVNKENI